MVDYGLMGAFGQGVQSFVDSYRTERNYQDQKKKDAEEKAIKERLARAQEADAAAKTADVLGYVPKGLVSRDVEGMYSPGGETQSAPKDPGEAASQPAPAAGAQSNSTGLMQGSSSSGLMGGASPAGGSAVQGDAGFLTRPIDTKIMPKHVRDGIKEATQLSATNFGKGVIYKYDPDMRVVRQFAAPRSREQELNLNNLELENQKKKEDLNNVKPEQGQAALYGKRMQQAEQVFQGLKNKGYNRGTPGEEIQNSWFYPGMLQSSEFRQQDQAERNFVNAILRRESGSAISKDEFASAEKQYFPRPGDSPEVLAQKEANRLLAIEGMKQQAGPKTWKELNTPVVAVTPPAGKKSKGLIPEALANQENSFGTGPHGDTVKQNGVTYKWNPSTKRYE